jgi:hypothetical protein
VWKTESRVIVLTTLLEQNREAVLAKWFEVIAGTYPKQTSDFLAKQKDRFRNPIGYAIERSIGPVYDQIVSAMDDGELRAALDSVVRIRSVQEFAPSEAVAFVFQLKSVIRDVLGDRVHELERDLDSRDEIGELADLDARIDRVALLAFDVYTGCREKLFEIRANEIRKQSNRLLERVNPQPSASKNKGESVDDVI